VADALPGLGIVAAVLGVVITMGSLGGPPSRSAKRWQQRWWALSSAFCCATASPDPWQANMTKTADEHNEYLHVLRVLMLSHF
jgi:chemotaxis protein MotA